MQGADRGRQRRFVAVVLAAPFALMAAWPSVFSVNLPRDLGFGALAATFVLSWVLVAHVASRGTLARAGIVSMTGAIAVASLALAGAGGLSSPVALLAVALVFEAWWIMRSRESLRWGALAAAAVVGAQLVGDLAGLIQQTTFTAGLWLIPMAYGATMVPRLSGALRDELESRRPPPETALADVLDAVILHVAPGGEIRDATGRSQALLGVASELLLGDAFVERVHVADRVPLMRAIAAAADVSTHLELRIRVAGTPAGTFRSFAAEMTAGRPRLLILRDNSQTQALRAELDRVREQVASSDIAKARFLAAVSHELRTPLNAIIGFSDMLAHEMVGAFSDPRQREYSCLIRESGNHLLSVVNSILDVSRIESGAYPIKPEPFRFADAAAASQAMLELQAREKSIELRNCVLPAVGEICADRRAVQQILINLLTNAVKFTPRGGAVKLDARRHGRLLTIEVSDTGIGIAAEDLERLGKPFAQVHNDYTRQYDGAGLGLSITKGLVALHGGGMSIQSSPGAGTVVTVNLPVEANGIDIGREAGIRTAQAEEDDSVTFRKSA